MNVILMLTTVTIMPNVLTQTGHLFATVVMDFLGMEYFVKVQYADYKISFEFNTNRRWNILHFQKQKRTPRLLYLITRDMILIIHFGQLYSIFNYGNQFARVQLAQHVNNNANMRNVLSLYLVTLCIFLDC